MRDGEDIELYLELQRLAESWRGELVHLTLFPEHERAFDRSHDPVRYIEAAAFRFPGTLIMIEDDTVPLVAAHDQPAGGWMRWRPRDGFADTNWWYSRGPTKKLPPPWTSSHGLGNFVMKAANFAEAIARMFPCLNETRPT